MSTWVRDRGRQNKRWRLEADPDELVLTSEHGRLVLAGEDLRRLSVRGGWFFASLLVDGTAPLRLKGLRKRDAPDVEAAVTRALARHRALRRCALRSGGTSRCWAPCVRRKRRGAGSVRSADRRWRPLALAKGCARR